MQGVPRRVLKVILSIESGAKSQTQGVARKHGSSLVVPPPSQTESMPTKTQPEPNPETNVAIASKSVKALSIIAEESGIEAGDLIDTLVFTDAGVDSLMSLTISAWFKEEMDLDIDFNALFSDYPTIKKLKEFIGDSWVSTIPIEGALGAPCNSTSGSSPPSSSTPNTTEITTPNTNTSIKFQRALAIVSEESGVAIEDFTDDSCFAENGVDSLLSLVIASRFRDELEFDITHESLFLECPTVVDLRRLIEGDAAESNDISLALLVEAAPGLTPAPESVEVPARSEAETASLTTRTQTVKGYVQKYTSSFSGPSSAPSNFSATDYGKVILITGATGGLGTHLTYHIAQLPDVKTVICLNRENASEGYIRQQKAMRDKGIRFPETLKHKLQVFQTDSSKPRLGLSNSDYGDLLNSVTHLIHNAWPMSAKRPLSGFESQFQVMRNLIDFACEIASLRPMSFKFGFQLVLFH